jgi:multidrug efflux pump subunit AcrA (membrane-fusion protein)
MIMVRSTSAQRRVTRIVGNVAAIIGVTVLHGACSGGAKVAPASAAATTVTPPRDTAFLTAESLRISGIAAQPIQRVAWRDAWQLPARLVLDPTSTQALGSIVEGRVTQVRVQPGDRVRRGQVLVTIHSHELTAAHNDLAQAAAGRAEAENAAQLAATASARAERLYAAQAGSLADLERARAARTTAAPSTHARRRWCRICDHPGRFRRVWIRKMSWFAHPSMVSSSHDTLSRAQL